MAKKTQKAVEGEQVPDQDLPILFSDLVGHAGRVAYLRRALVRGVLPQTLLLTGPPGVGKTTLARMVAAAIECEHPAEGAACGACGPCGKVRRALHPDVRLLTFERNEKGKPRTEIVVDQARRTVLEPLALPPYEGRKLVFIVDPADALNVNAQNALLKSLEEPPAYAQFLLVTANPAGLLPTVRSRSQELTLGPVGGTEMEKAMDRAGIPSGERAMVLALAGGAPGRILGGAASPAAADREALVALLAKGLDASAYPDLNPVVEKLAKENPWEVLAAIVGLVRDAHRVLLGQAPRLHADLAGPLTQAAQTRGIRGLQTIAERLGEAPGHLDRNVNSRLLLERLFLVP